jgi:hypothetical protein
VSTTLTAMLLSLPLLAGGAYDPLPGIFRSKEDAANMDCRRLSQAEAHLQFPGEIPEPAARTLAGTTTDVLACRRRFIRLGERPARDEVILTSLRQTASDIVQAALAQAAPSGGEKKLTWHVDAFYPSTEVAAKISVAAKTELAERGHLVSDRVPLLAAGDIAVLSRLPPRDAYPIACTRYFAEGTLKESDAFLGLMIVDARETQLHGGVCVAGKWTWFR